MSNQINLAIARLQSTLTSVGVTPQDWAEFTNSFRGQGAEMEHIADTLCRHAEDIRGATLAVAGTEPDTVEVMVHAYARTFLLEGHMKEYGTHHLWMGDDTALALVTALCEQFQAIKQGTHSSAVETLNTTLSASGIKH
jgi:hypothetical protein